MGYQLGGVLWGSHQCVFFCFFLKVRQCRNWAEYRELLAGRERRRKGRQEHLWNREVTPLHDPRLPIPTGETTRTSETQPECRFWIWFKSWCLVLVFLCQRSCWKKSAWLNPPTCWRERPGTTWFHCAEKVWVISTRSYLPVVTLIDSSSSWVMTYLFFALIS